MIDWTLLLAPLLLLPITLLLVFLGCGLSDTGTCTSCFLTFQLTDTQNGSTATVDAFGTGSGNINANVQDLVNILVAAGSSSSSSTGTSSVKIEQSPDGVNWSKSMLPNPNPIPLSGGTNGGNGMSQFSIPQGMTSLFLRANQFEPGGYVTPAIQVSITVPTTPPAGTTNITVSSNPAGPNYVQVDGQPITTPQTFNWQTGSTHMLTANSPVGGYIFQSWSDGGAQTHTITVATPTTYAANYTQSQPTPITRVQPVNPSQPIRGTLLANMGKTITVTLPMNPTNGNNLYAVIAIQGSGQTVSSISPIGGSSWTKVVSSASSNGQADVEIWKAENVSGASNTVTITLTGSPGYGAVADVLEYSGLATNGTDQTNSASGQSGTASTGSVTTTIGNELWLGAICSYGAAINQSTVSGGFTLIDGTLSGPNTVCAVLEETGQPAGTAVSGCTCGINWWAGCIATFKGT